MIQDSRCKECLEEIERTEALQHFKEEHPDSDVLKKYNAWMVADCRHCQGDVSFRRMEVNEDGNVIVPEFCDECAEGLMHLLVREIVNA